MLQAAAHRLDEQRITANEERLTLELELGRHHELVGELTELVGEYPLREQLRGQLMLALYRCGRAAEALQVYRETRRTMIDELGIEPGERLRQLEHAVLTADPSLDLPARRVKIDPVQRQVPGLLPADIADFTGRAEEIDEIRGRLIPGHGEEARLAVPVVVITGRGGVGKTSLAVHAAHGVDGRFPDGQLFADLHAGGPQPVGPMRALERFLRALGVAGSQLPDDLDERAEMYRGLLVGRSVLVVLDDAASESLVSDPLSWWETEHAALLAGVRQAAQAGLIEACWGLALSAAPFFESRVYLDDWQETHDIALEAARNAHDIRGEAAMLYSIAELHMTRKQPGLADSVAAAIAAERLFQEIGEETGQALATRHIAYVDRLNGRLDDAERRYEQALSIFRKTEDHVAATWVLQNMAGVELERNDPGAAKELLAEALRLIRIAGYGRFEAQVLYRMGEASLLTGELDGAIGAFRSALLLVRDIGDLIGEAYALRGIGVTQVRQGELGQAREALRRAVELAVVTGERLIEAQALRALGELALASGEPGQAVAHARQAAALFRTVDTPLEEARALTLLGDAHAARGEADDARAAAADAAAIRAKLGHAQA
jgi:tetratricopeptide (TPR) repeat protein